MAEPDDFGNAAAPSAPVQTTQPIIFSYGFGDLPAGTTLKMELTVGGVTKSKTLTVPANKTAVGCNISITGKLQ